MQGGRSGRRDHGLARHSLGGFCGEKNLIVGLIAFSNDLDTLGIVGPPDQSPLGQFAEIQLLGLENMEFSRLGTTDQRSCC